MIGIIAEDAEERFRFQFEALHYGALPHARIKLGLDLWLMIFSGIDNIREVIASPKTQKASDLMSGASSEVDQQKLRNLSIKVDVPRK